MRRVEKRNERKSILQIKKSEESISKLKRQWSNKNGEKAIKEYIMLKHICKANIITERLTNEAHRWKVTMEVDEIGTWRIETSLVNFECICFCLLFS